jgi:hypothetical protein
LGRQASFAQEVAAIQDGDDRFFAAVGDDRELDFAFLDIKDGVRRVALRKNYLVL